ncbi:MAG: hypothetical protein IKT65_02695 [Clostridia bacterium]|nr:hypothetical protein [Clostridia bacterium]
MKRIICSLLISTMFFAFFFGCENVEVGGEKTDVQSDTVTESANEETNFPNGDILNEDSEKYVITLPNSLETIELKKGHITDERFIKFIPHISQELVINAELQLLSETEQYSNRSDFYLQTDKDDYLCLAVEVIKQLDLSTFQESEGEVVEGGCGIDHEHLFFEKRISTQAVKETDGDKADAEIYYGVASFFEYQINENVENPIYDTCTSLTSKDAERLLKILNEAKWINDNIIDRRAFFFNGYFELASETECVYFGYEQRILYRGDSYASICEEDVIFLTKLHGISKPNPQISASKGFSDFLDQAGLLPGTSQGDFISLMTNLSSHLSEDELAAMCHYDGPNGGGCMSDGELFGFANDYCMSEDEEKVTYTNSFYTYTYLQGLKFPADICFGDTLMTVISSKMRIKYPEIVLQIGQELELYSDEMRTIKVRSDEDKSSIVYMESYEIAQTDIGAPIIDVERRVTLLFDECDKLYKITAFVVETY